MTNSRTKQQTACDGVRTAWQSDAFTQILHQQVSTKFSMDGVVPSEGIAPVQVMKEVAQTSKVPTLKLAQKKIVKIVGTMDGIRKQLKPARAA